MYVPIIFAFEMTLTMSIRMSFNTGDFKGVSKEQLGEDFVGVLQVFCQGDFKGDLKGLMRGT